MYKAKWRGTYVAVKILKSEMDKVDLQEFELEAALMKYDDYFDAFFYTFFIDLLA